MNPLDLAPARLVARFALRLAACVAVWSAVSLLLLAAAGCGVTETPPAFASTALGQTRVGVTHPLAKIRPDSAVPSASSAHLDAARNEFEPFQIVVGGGAAVQGLRAAAGPLSGPRGAQIPVEDVRLYQVGLYKVLYASNVEGAAGEWPDPLLPDVDAYVNEHRNGFPFDVPAGEARAIFVELFVPTGIPAGVYTGAVTLSAAQGLPQTVVPVSLRVRDFDLPATASLTSSFGFSVDSACRAHRGETYCASDADAAPLLALYGRAALEHRISFWDPYYRAPSADLAVFDASSGPLLDGSAKSRLAGARFTSVALGTRDPAAVAATAAHFGGKGWKGLFDYTCDEPPMTCAWSDIAPRAVAPQKAGVPTLVTTSVDKLAANNLLDAVDIVVPNVVDDMQPRGLGGDSVDNRGRYDAFLARSPKKQVWMYQSCDSHGCGGCAPSQANDPQSGWPSYMIDASGIQNRAMEWLSYRFRVSGELYWETMFHADDAWNSHLPGHHALCDFGGSGDGALFYPGTPARIGGSTDIPVESQRLKLIREGMEDYEYLHLLDHLGGGDTALAEDVALFPAAYKVTQATPEALYAARARIADAIEQRLGVGATLEATVARAPSAIDVHGDHAPFAAATEIRLDAGDAHAIVRLLWDDRALYLDAQVTDPLLRAVGTGRDGELWNADGVELLVDPKRDRSLAPDGDDRHVIVTAAGDLLDARGAGAAEDRRVDLGVDYAVTVDGVVNGGQPSRGYRITMAIPWPALGVTPMPGQILGADLALNDLGGAALATRDWAGLSPYAQPARWPALRLLDGASPPGDGGVAHPGMVIAGCAVSGKARLGDLLAVAFAILLCAHRRRSS